MKKSSNLTIIFSTVIVVVLLVMALGGIMSNLNLSKDDFADVFDKGSTSTTVKPSDTTKPESEEPEEPEECNHIGGTLSYFSYGDGTHQQKRSCCGEPVSLIRNCTFDANGVCEYCGYQSACTHDWVYEGGLTESECSKCGEICLHGDAVYGQYYSVDDTYHDLTVICPDCGATDKGSNINPAGQNAMKHYYKDGVCTLCGHEQTE